MSEGYHISEIWIYPIKSLGGIQLKEASVLQRGLRYDRRWMLVDENGLFLSQRSHTRMAFFDVRLEESGIFVTDRLSENDNRVLVPFEPDTSERLQVTIWDNRVEAQLVSDKVDQWFTEKLGQRVRLVFLADDSIRKVDERYAKNGEEVSFADGYPILMISQASLDFLNEKLSSPVEMLRFRPNLVVTGTLAFEEDGWTKIMAGDLEMHVVKPCSRCVMTTIDLVTGVKAAEPLKTLATFRKNGNKILFGQNMLVVQEGVIKVGDEVRPALTC